MNTIFNNILVLPESFTTFYIGGKAQGHMCSTGAGDDQIQHMDEQVTLQESLIQF